jgi:hydroxymethylglutaryl-CoA synthase
MVGIKSVGAYIPLYRLNRSEIAKVWGMRSFGGEKAVSGYDEDTITMAVAAVIDCLRQDEEAVNGLFFASTTAPYKEKQTAAIIASAVDLERECDTSDFTNSLRGGTIAMKSAIDSIKSGSVKEIIITASDSRIGAAQGMFEQLLGDGAAALLISSNDVIATIEGRYSIFNEFTDTWRTEKDVFVRSSEERFIEAAGYLPTMQEVISELMKKFALTPANFSKLVCYAPDARSHIILANSLGFNKAQIQDSLFDRIGNTGAAAALIMLIAALEEAKPGDRILFASYGDGADAFVLNVTKGIEKIRRKTLLKDKIAGKILIDYGRYASWRNLITIEASRRPENPIPSKPCLWRERKSIFALYGVKCKKCGTPQYPPTRICAVCQAKDDFEDYKFSHRTGKLFTYAVDYLQPTQNPPGINGVVDFNGGGRFTCELTDCEPGKVNVGMPVEMTFRKLYQSGEINNYFWKAKPIIE